MDVANSAATPPVGATGADLFGLARLLLRRWPLLAAGVIAGIVMAAIYLNLATYRYTATLVLAPAQQTSSSLSSRLGSLGGVAAAAGVNLDDIAGSGGQFKLYIEALRSFDVARTIADDPATLRKLFPDEWDASAGRWRPAEGIVPSAVRLVKTVTGLDDRRYTPPDAARVLKLLSDKLGVEQNPRSPVAVVTFDHPDPAFAASLLRRLHRTADSMLRRRALDRADRYVAYLTSQLPTVTLAEQRAAIAQALGEQERVRMAANSGQTFAADVFSGPSVSFRPTSPNIPLTMILGALLGLGAGVWAALAMPGRRARGGDAAPDD